MKRLLLCCSLIAVSCTTVMAQAAKPTQDVTAKQANLKTELSAKIADFKTQTAANNNDAAMKTYTEMVGIMYKAISATSVKMNGLKETEDMVKVRAVFSKQNGIQSNLKFMATDIAANKAKMITAMEEFLGTL